MRHIILISAIVILALSVVATKADLLNCDDQFGEILGVGPKMASQEDSGGKVKDVLKRWGCKIKKGATEFGNTVKEKTKEWNEGVSIGINKLKEKAKDIGAKIETKFNDFKEHLSMESDESTENNDKKFFLENIEIINPDILKADQECGHGHILDSLGNCRKLRK